MTLFDLVLLLAIALAVLGGWRLGFLTRVLSWVGLAAGLLVGLKVLPALLRRLETSNRVLVVVLAMGLLMIAATIGQALGLLIGGRVAPVRRDGAIGTADRVLGALAGFAGAVVLIWLLVPVLVATPGWISQQTSGSFVARTIDRSLPPPPDVMNTLRALIGDDAAPDVFDALRPTPSAGPPPGATGLSSEVTASVARSVVKVEGTACSKVQDGTGWVAAPGLVVTNAHVVAGERSTAVLRDDGRRFDASIVAFDPARDLAVLRVDGLDRPPLPLDSSTPSARTTGGVFGHPGGEALRVAPFAVARAIDATGRDIYGGDRTDREVLELAAQLRPGDSGSALVDGRGVVVGVAFAVARDRSDVAYALAPNEVRDALTAVASAPVATGPCLA